MNYKSKYLKYKLKYLKAKQLYGGSNSSDEIIKTLKKTNINQAENPLENSPILSGISDSVINENNDREGVIQELTELRESKGLDSNPEILGVEIGDQIVSPELVNFSNSRKPKVVIPEAVRPTILQPETGANIISPELVNFSNALILKPEAVKIVKPKAVRPKVKSSINKKKTRSLNKNKNGK
tara:strand:+ start:1188 stop:1736 length:549 start_codon:yes stop_codon:yes gene_type:complete